MREKICHKIISIKKTVTCTTTNTNINNNITTATTNNNISNHIATITDATTSNTNNTSKASFKKKIVWFKHKHSKNKNNKTAENK